MSFCKNLRKIMREGGNYFSRMMAEHICADLPAWEEELPGPRFRVGDTVTEKLSGGVGVIKSRLYVEEHRVWVYYIKWNGGPDNQCVSGEEDLELIAQRREKAYMSATRGGEGIVQSGHPDTIKRLAKTFEERGYKVIVR